MTPALKVTEYLSDFVQTSLELGFSSADRTRPRLCRVSNVQHEARFNVSIDWWHMNWLAAYQGHTSRQQIDYLATVWNDLGY